MFGQDIVVISDTAAPAGLFGLNVYDMSVVIKVGFRGVRLSDSFMMIHICPQNVKIGSEDD